MKMKKLLLLTLFTYMLQAEVSPENILTKNCLNSYLHTYKTQKDHKAFVYARESDTGKDRCGWGYGYESVDAAKKGAMKQCTEFQLNAECIIIDTDGEYLVKEGDFSTISQPDETPLSEKEKEQLIEEAKGLIRGNCLPFFKDYLKDKGHKVFAYSLDVDGKYACGKTYSNATLVAAKKGAIKGCNDNKNKRAQKRPSSPCKLYAIGNEILLHAKDFGIDALPKVEKILGDDEYNAKLKKAKTIVKKGACLFQMKYYLRGSEHQAYFLAQDKEGKQVCGRSEGELSLDVALSKALKQCQDRVQKKNLKATCKLVAKEFSIVGDASDFVVKEEKKESKKNIEKPKPFQTSITAKDLKSQNSVDKHKLMSLNETLQITVKTLNKNLPTMLDEELRLDSVGAKGSQMSFMYTLVHFTPKEMPAKRLRELMYKDIKTQVCTDKESKMMLKKGMLVDYVYNGKNKKHITTFAFDAKTCGLTTNLEKIKKNILKLIKKKEK